MRAAKLILNPQADRGRAATLLPQIQSVLKSHGVDAEAATTHARGHAMDLAQRAKEDGFPLVIAAGGDGTVNEVINGLARAVGDGVVGTLGIVPLGTGNDFVKALALPKDWRAACARVGAGTVRRSDVGRVNGRLFQGLVGIGFDAQVVVESFKIKRLHGSALYVAALARQMLLSYRTPVVQIELDAERLTQSVTLVTVGNHRYSGGGAFLLTPDAKVDDGLFDVCIADAMSKGQILALVPHVMKGTHVGRRGVRMARARRVVVTSAEPLPVHADGEILYTDAHHLEVEILPQRLEVIG